MEAELGASPQVKLLMAVAVVAVFWMFIWKTKAERRATRMIKWIWENHPEAWQDLPWLYRNVLRERGLEEIVRRGAIPDPAFRREYEETRPSQKHMVIAALVAGAAILLIFVGTSFLGWRW